MSEDSSDEPRDGKPEWVSGTAMERVFRDAPADRALLDDLAVVRQQVVESR